MGLIFDDEFTIFLIGLFIVLFVLIGMGIGVSIEDYDKQLADAICDERYGTEYKSFEYDEGFGFTIEGIVCKSPIKQSEKYDGLIVKIG